MILSIDFSSEEPIYLQIRSQIVHAVATGELQAGDALPSVRSLAADLGVNMHTVNKTYAVLRDEGYATMRRGSGVVIANRAASLSPETRSQGGVRFTGCSSGRCSIRCGARRHRFREGVVR